MRLDPLVRDYRAFMEELGIVLNDDRTRFYLDTSILLLLVRLGYPARCNFIDWCSNRSLNAIRIPVWSAHEFHRHVVQDTVKLNVGSTSREVENKLKEFVRLAWERADDGVCQGHGYPSRASYISEIGRSSTRLLQLLAVAKDKTTINQATEQVISLINKHALDTNLLPIINYISEAGEFRYSHFIPPGYKDKKEHNRYGDVVVWEEVIADITDPSDTAPRSGVIVSCDNKRDWISGARLLSPDGDSPTKPNRRRGLDVPRPDPLLAHEFASRSGAEQIYVLHPRFLALAVSYTDRKSGKPDSLSDFSEVFYPEALLPTMERDGLSGTTTPTSPVMEAQQQEAGQSPEHAEPIVPNGVNEISVVDVMGETSADEIGLYAVESPENRSLRVRSWVDDLVSGEMKPIKFGRLLAALVVQRHGEWVSELPGIFENVKMQIGDQEINEAMLGAITPAYFDRYGDLRTHPAMTLGAIVLTLEDDPAFTTAFAHLKDYLVASDAELPYIPGTGRQPLMYSVDLIEYPAGSPNMLRDLRLSGQAAFIDRLSANNTRRLSFLLNRTPDEGCTGAQLRSLVAREYIVPVDCLSSKTDKKKITWPSRSGLVSMDTSSPGGLSTVADEGEYDLG